MAPIQGGLDRNGFASQSVGSLHRKKMPPQVCMIFTSIRLANSQHSRDGFPHDGADDEASQRFTLGLGVAAAATAYSNENEKLLHERPVERFGFSDGGRWIALSGHTWFDRFIINADILESVIESSF